MTFSPPIRKESKLWRASCCASFRFPACSRLLQGFLPEEELCYGGVAMSRLFRCDLSLWGLGGGLSLQLSLWHSAASFLSCRSVGIATTTRGCETWFCRDLRSVVPTVAPFCRSFHPEWSATVWRVL